MMKRITDYKLLLPGATILALLPACQGEKLPEKPNIIYIMADDLGYGDLGVYGQTMFQTPNLDRMAAEGLRFTQHYAGTTVSAPSRCCLMTGYHTGHAVVRGNREVKPEGQQPMPEGTVTVADLLQTAGYSTAIFGKWGLGFPGSVSDPNHSGFDEFFGYNCQRHAHRHYTDYLWHNGQRDSIPENRNDQYVTYSQDLIVQHTLEYLRKHKDGPFFIYAAFTLPHAELLVPQEYMEPYRGKFKEVPFPGAGNYRAQAEPRAAYAGMVSHIDHDVKLILDEIKKLGIAGNTVVFFTSDNGPHREGGNDPDYFNSHGIYRGIKRDLYEGGIREPFIAWWPGHVKPGVTDHIAAFWDFLPTACDLAGISAPEGVDGISYLPVLTGQKPKEHEYLYWEFHEGGGKQAVREGNWKAVKLNVSREDNPPIELYDLATDPSESHDVAAEHPDVVQEMQQRMNEAHVSDERWPLFKSERK